MSIERITVDPNIHFGKPCISGTRITVQSVLELVNEGLSFKEPDPIQTAWSESGASVWCPAKVSRNA